MLLLTIIFVNQTNLNLILDHLLYIQVEVHVYLLFNYLNPRYKLYNHRQLNKYELLIVEPMQLHSHNLYGFVTCTMLLMVFFNKYKVYLESSRVIYVCSISIIAKYFGYLLFQASLSIGLDLSVSYRTDECFKSRISNCLTLPSAPTEAKISFSLEK